MRIACVGKGGSGKTTLASTLARYAASLGIPVLAIDADINQHLAAALGGHTPPSPIGHDQLRLGSILAGTNARIQPERVIKSTPPGSGSHFVRINARDAVMQAFTVDVAPSLSLMATGEPAASDVGVSCFHARTGAVELVLNHLLDTSDELVICDMTAGADAFASGLFTRFDLTIVVVEPTHKSLSVWNQYSTRAREYDVNLAVIANKCQLDCDDDVAFVREHVGDAYLGAFYDSAFVRHSERKGIQPLTELEPLQFPVLDAAIDAVRRSHVDRQQMYEIGLRFHSMNASSWANAQFDCDLEHQIDPTFVWPTLETSGASHLTTINQ
jgi:CO dehydrogenase maturation factor